MCALLTYLLREVLCHTIVTEPKLVGGRLLKQEVKDVCARKKCVLTVDLQTNRYRFVLLVLEASLTAMSYEMTVSNKCQELDAETGKCDLKGSATSCYELVVCNRISQDAPFMMVLLWCDAATIHLPGAKSAHEYGVMMVYMMARCCSC